MKKLVVSIFPFPTLDFHIQFFLKEAFKEEVFTFSTLGGERGVKRSVFVTLFKEIFKCVSSHSESFKTHIL